MSKNFTRGYGPQEYLLKKAVKGTYLIKSRLISPKNALIERIGLMISAKIYTNYGRPTEQEQVVSVLIDHQEKFVTLAKIVV